MTRIILSLALVVSLVFPVSGQEQSGPVLPSSPGAEGLLSPLPAQSPRVDIPADRSVTMSYEPGDGLTVSMLNDTSRLKLFGQFSALGIASTDRPFSAGLPLLILPPPVTGVNSNTFDLHARQSGFGAQFSGPDVLGFTPGAYFFGFIQNDVLTNDAYGLLPYQGYGELKNNQWRIAAGLQLDVFSPRKPTLISLGVLFGSGNVGSFRSQARVEHLYKPTDAFEMTTQVAISEPVASSVTNNLRLLEDNGWPNVEARVAAGFGMERELYGSRIQRPVEFGVSGVVGQLRNSLLQTAPPDPNRPNFATIDVWGLSLDGQCFITDRFGVVGELFIGQGLGEYNGGILQVLNGDTFNPIRTRGGWGEVYYYLTDKLHLHCGYGIDAPIRRDLAPLQFAKNQTYFANLVWDASKVLQISFEVDYRKTNYIAFPNADGVIFLTQMLWRF